MRMTMAFAATAALLGFPAGAQEISEDAQLAFNNNCRTCHSRDEGDHRLGPSLHQVIGRQAGSLEGFQYSDSMADADFAWDAERLDAFIENPESVVPGTNMTQPYSGIADEQVRSSIIEALGGSAEGGDEPG